MEEGGLVGLVLVVLVTAIFVKKRLGGRHVRVREWLLAIFIACFVISLCHIKRNLGPRTNNPNDGEEFRYLLTSFTPFPYDPKNEYEYRGPGHEYDFYRNSCPEKERDDGEKLGYLLTQLSSFSDAPEDEFEVEAAGRGGEWGRGRGRGLEYDFYRNSCPQAERIVQAVVRDVYRVRASVAPALVRLLFHDCFIEGCDASVLLDPAEGMGSEKDSPPNDGLKGFDVIDAIKSQLELACPGIVSCADIVALAGREGIVEAGGPLYPLLTGRRDSFSAYQDIATEELPSPDADLPHTLAAFASKGFDERETVSLLGAHSIGMIHCKFFENRLYNFSGTDKPDPSMDAAFLTLLRASCKGTEAAAPASSLSRASPLSGPSSPAPSNPPYRPSMSPSSSSAPSNPSFGPSMSPSSSFAASAPYRPRTSPSMAPSFGGSPSSLSDIKTEDPADTPSAGPLHSPKSSDNEPAVNMGYKGAGPDFGSVYYRRLLQRKGILYSDQQLMAGEHTGTWVRAYAADPSLFRKDFALAMMKLSHLRALTGSEGQVRRKCSKVL